MLIQVCGSTAYCYTAGKKLDPARPTLVFIHGAQNDHSVWALQSRYFAYHGYNVMAIDLPGHGRSSGPALTTVEAMAAWLIALMDAAGISQASLVGHSMGSLIALDTVRCAAQRVSRVALLGNAYPMKVADALLTMARDNEPAAIDMVTSWSHCAPTQITPVPGFNLQASARRLMQKMSAINPDRLFFTDFSACNSYQQGDAAAQVINQRSCPVLFIMAKQDRMTPTKASAALRGALVHATSVEIDHCGHSLMTEQPDATLDALIEFLR